MSYYIVLEPIGPVTVNELEDGATGASPLTSLSAHVVPQEQIINLQVINTLNTEWLDFRKILKQNYKYDLEEILDDYYVIETLGRTMVGLLIDAKTESLVTAIKIATYYAKIDVDSIPQYLTPLTSIKNGSSVMISSSGPNISLNKLMTPLTINTSEITYDPSKLAKLDTGSLYLSKMGEWE